VDLKQQPALLLEFLGSKDLVFQRFQQDATFFFE